MPIRNLEEFRKEPLPTADEAEKSFTAYKNYLVHIDSCLGGIYGVAASLVPGVVSDVRSAGKFGSIQRRKPVGKEREAITKALTISWAKELQLRIPAIFDSQLLPHLIQGSGHLAYYASSTAPGHYFSALVSSSSRRTPRPWPRCPLG